MFCYNKNDYIILNHNYKTVYEINLRVSEYTLARAYVCISHITKSLSGGKPQLYSEVCLTKILSSSLKLE